MLLFDRAFLSKRIFGFPHLNTMNAAVSARFYAISMVNIAWRSFAMIVCVAALCVAAAAQTQPPGSAVSIDRSLQDAFGYLGKAKYTEARTSLEEALAIFGKDPAPSKWLFTKITLPDENPNETPKDGRERTIVGYRHSMGTKQALLMFLAYTYELEGDKAQAEKYSDAVYDLQSPIWGLSWRTFIPPLSAMFYSAVGKHSSESYGRYLFLNGRFIYSSGDDKVSLKFMEEGRLLSPKDGDLPAELAGYYVMRLDSANTKKFAEMSLALDPKQNRVLIDLANADWLSGDLAAADKHANASIAIDPDMPGPYATLTFVAIERGDLKSAKKNAEKGMELSNSHPFYRLIRAASLAAEGNESEAKKEVATASKKIHVDEERLKAWFFRGKPLDLMLKILSSE